MNEDDCDPQRGPEIGDDKWSWDGIPGPDGRWRLEDPRERFAPSLALLAAAQFLASASLAGWLH